MNIGSCRRSVAHGAFSIRRSYDAAPARLWRAFADPAAYRRWSLESEGHSVFDWVHDFRTGGRSRMRFRFGDEANPVFRHEIVHVELVPGRRIVNSLAIGMEPHPALLTASLVVIELVEMQSGTCLVYNEQGAFFADDSEDAVAVRRAMAGSALQALSDELCGGIAAAAAPETSAVLA